MCRTIRPLIISEVLVASTLLTVAVMLIPLPSLASVACAAAPLWPAAVLLTKVRGVHMSAVSVDFTCCACRDPSLCTNDASVSHGAAIPCQPAHGLLPLFALFCE